MAIAKRAASRATWNSRLPDSRLYPFSADTVSAPVLSSVRTIRRHRGPSALTTWVAVTSADTANDPDSGSREQVARRRQAGLVRTALRCRRMRGIRHPMSDTGEQQVDGREPRRREHLEQAQPAEDRRQRLVRGVVVADLRRFSDRWGSSEPGTAATASRNSRNQRGAHRCQPSPRPAQREISRRPGLGGAGFLGAVSSRAAPR